MIDSRWGLHWGLRQGLSSGLMTTTSRLVTALAGGTSPVEVFSLFAILCASISVSLWKQDKIEQVKSKNQEVKKN